VWVVGGYMLGTIALYGDNPHAYDRQHPSPAGGEPEVVFLATATASAAYTVIDTVERDTGRSNCWTKCLWQFPIQHPSTTPVTSSRPPVQQTADPSCRHAADPPRLSTALRSSLERRAEGFEDYAATTLL